MSDEHFRQGVYCSCERAAFVFSFRAVARIGRATAHKLPFSVSFCEVRVTNADDPVYVHLMIDVMGEESAALIERSEALRQDARELVAASRRLRARSGTIGERLDAMRAFGRHSRH